MPADDFKATASRAERIAWVTTLTVLIALAVFMLGLWN